MLVAALLLFSPLAAEAQNTTKKKLKVAVPPFTFESIVIHSGAEGEFNPTGGWLFLEATNGLSKLPGYEIEWMPAYEIMTDLDAVAWGSRALKEKRWDLVVGGPPTGIERPEMQDIVSIPSAMVHVAVLGLKKTRDPNMMQFVTPFAADVWLTLGACVLLGAAVIVALMFAEERSMHKEVRKEEILWSVYESFAALLNHESIESRYISIVMASPLGRVFRLALLFLVLIVTATYTANLAAFLTAPNVVELGPKTMDELKRATVCIRNTILTPYILPFIGTNAPNPLTVAEQADGRLTEEWTRRALEAGECDAIAEINGFAQRRLIDNCKTLHMPRAIAFGNHIPLGMMRGETAEEREIARNFTAGLMDWYARLHGGEAQPGERGAGVSAGRRGANERHRDTPGRRVHRVLRRVLRGVRRRDRQGVLLHARGGGESKTRGRQREGGRGAQVHGGRPREVPGDAKSHAAIFARVTVGQQRESRGAPGVRRGLGVRT